MIAGNAGVGEHRVVPYYKQNQRTHHLRKFSTPSSNLSMKNQKKSKAECRYTAHDYVTPSNIPLELHYYISSYINSVNERNLAEPFLVSSMEIGKKDPLVLNLVAQKIDYT